MGLPFGNLIDSDSLLMFFSIGLLLVNLLGYWEGVIEPNASNG